MFIINPLLISAHPMTPNQQNWPVGIRRIQAIIIGHNLLSLRVSKHLISAQSMTITAANFLARFVAHRVQAILGLGVSDLSINI